MVDTQRLKENCDLRRLVEQDLGPAPLRGGHAYLWKCPFHREQKGFSLAVWANGYRCFGACDASGDALDWLQRYRGVSFIEACEYLGAEQKADRIVRSHLSERSTANFTREAEPPNDSWQEAAKQVVDAAESVLWSPDGERALGYLKKRGLTEETIMRARLGYLPGHA